jgi:hypothetical protein
MRQITDPVFPLFGEKSTSAGKYGLRVYGGAFDNSRLNLHDFLGKN